MAAEVSRAVDSRLAVASGKEVVTEGIAKAARSQGPESIDSAIRSFAWAYSKDQQSDAPEWSASDGPIAVQVAGFVDSPLNYLTYASKTAASVMTGFSELVPTDQLLTNLSRQGFHIQRAVSSFLESGIQEALASLKINPDPKVPDPLVPSALNDLISPENLKNLDANMLRASIRAVNKMCTTLKKMQQAGSEIQVNMLRFMRV